MYSLSIGDKFGDLAWPVTEVKIMTSSIHAAGYSKSQLVLLDEVCAAQKCGLGCPEPPCSVPLVTSMRWRKLKAMISFESPWFKTGKSRTTAHQPFTIHPALRRHCHSNSRSLNQTTATLVLSATNVELSVSSRISCAKMTISESGGGKRHFCRKKIVDRAYTCQWCLAMHTRAVVNTTAQQ